jgi:hypothetical protein
MDRRQSPGCLDIKLDVAHNLGTAKLHGVQHVQQIAYNPLAAQVYE